ncbi:PilZ domain-containing protein [Thalassorhabdomicrobium marinisediminis]|uniref:PilZ domain-containing protein n=1 Tax=Thalassorhabdomicrobium marinisediminis TaxID=2170577 RepID=UPI00249031D3|nr:PilZ domain-containing protein [Thalassorhabdomicrobium marinisediminis]
MAGVTALKRLAGAVWLAVMAGPAAAQMCAVMYEVERLEAVLMVAPEATPDADPARTVAATIGQLVRRTRDLSAFVTRDAAFNRAVAAYATDVARIHGRQPAVGVQITARALAAPAHHALLRRMMTLGTPICTAASDPAPPTEDAVDTSTQAGAMSALRGLGGAGAVTRVALLLSAVLALVAVLLRAARNRALQKVRFSCNVPAMVEDDGGVQRLQLIDISAVGAKLRLSGDRPLLDHIFVTLGRRTVAARVAWQNSHYAGLVFRRTLPARQVRQISNGEVERRAPDARAR